MSCAVHTSHFPVSARNFVLPLVCRLRRMGLPSELWFQSKPGFESVEQELSSPTRKLPIDVSTNVMRLLSNVQRFRREIGLSRPSVVHAHQMRGALVPLLAAYLERIPVRIYHNHGLPYLGYKGPLRLTLRAFEAINMRLATHVLLVSHSNLSAARSDGLLKQDAGKVLGFGSIAGIDLDQFSETHFSGPAATQAREFFDIPKDDFVLGYVGRPVARKGFHRLVRAWHRIQPRLAGSRLLVAGCTADECARAGAFPHDGIQGLGYLGDLRQFYAACDAVILPSEHEGFPYSLLEAAAAGRALIGSDIPGIRCAIRDGETGLLFSLLDDSALDSVITRLALNPAERQRFGAAARARVEREFDRHFVLEQLAQFYRELGLISLNTSAVA